ncbi:MULTISPECIES: right-handed parallel beta-helix repeat-containing protein [unclassified Caballeronia]|uniref:right-handed parallel beta-helix repeat-containing protein n=1 Tax=unclassified Caballeronia TaxID=2646786 RepID=UPI00285BAC6F|nr:MULTISPECIES: right-handed parallel beta-helix repeat-containing protein [unclassified Caballeronia]MDR5740287.1 right-handed parallel beta-helix repeat-containing protein [Caballeronia sp. LZ016]MDR5808533.1 right-handed parallel beta-helix repeat-containing protein [Caballeronia sp. LZ019]
MRSSAFGVKGDGTTNDRLRLQAAIDAAVGKTLLIEGRCRIDAKGLDLRSGSRVRFEPGASIKLLAHDTPFYQIIRLWDVTNVVLENAMLDGSKELNAAKPKRREEGYGMGISIAGSTDVTIRSATTTGCWGDGVYIANSYRSPSVAPEDIRLIEHHASDCRRQGVSIISGRNIAIERCTWQNIAGTAPSAGLDIEPNSNRDVLENIRVVDPVTRNCHIGILVFLAELPGPLAKQVTISISGHRDEGSTDNAFSVSGLDTKGFIVKGRVESRSPTWVDSRLASVESIDYDKRGPAIVVTGLRLVR